MKKTNTMNTMNIMNTMNTMNTMINMKEHNKHNEHKEHNEHNEDERKKNDWNIQFDSMCHVRFMLVNLILRFVLVSRQFLFSFVLCRLCYSYEDVTNSQL